MPTLLQITRRCKYYVFINAFICGIAVSSYKIVGYFHATSASLLALYLATLMRIAWVVLWFEWIATMKSRIYGEKRSQLTQKQRHGIYYRILWLVVPTECISYWIAQQRTTNTIAQSHLDWATFLIEFAVFIPKSLAFEVSFDFFHYGAHWTCHRVKWLYQHVHKRHHWHLHPCALSTYEQDAIDLCLTNVLPFVVASYVSPSVTTLQLHLLFAYKTYVEVAGHSGLEVKGFSFPQMPLLNAVTSICLRVHDHDLHHTHPKWNFAKRFALWDKIFGTFRPGKP